MKKIFKTSLAVALSVCMAAAMTACGGSGPLTGGAAVYGQAVKNAAEIAVDEVNAKGGIQFELQFEDDAHDPE